MTHRGWLSSIGCILGVVTVSCSPSVEAPEMDMTMTPAATDAASARDVQAAAGRMPICELSLHSWGESTDARLEEAVRSSLEHHDTRKRRSASSSPRFRSDR